MFKVSLDGELEYKPIGYLQCTHVQYNTTQSYTRPKKTVSIKIIGKKNVRSRISLFLLFSPSIEKYFLEVLDTSVNLNKKVKNKK